MTSSELSEWMAYDRIEPIGDIRGDIQAGVIASTLSNLMGKRRDGRASEPYDFLPFIERKKPNMAKLFKAQMAHKVVKKNADD